MTEEYLRLWWLYELANRIFSEDLFWLSANASPEELAEYLDIREEYCQAMESRNADNVKALDWRLIRLRVNHGIRQVSHRIRHPYNPQP